jgi:hypothetical protein
VSKIVMRQIIAAYHRQNPLDVPSLLRAPSLPLSHRDLCMVITFNEIFKYVPEGMFTYKTRAVCFH